MRVYWNENRKMLKLSAPTVFDDSRCLGQVAYGVQELPNDGREAVAQKWVAVVSESAGKAFTCIDDGIYGLDFKQGEIRLSMLRSPGYSSLYWEGNLPMAQDRFSPRIDQGQHHFSFWFNGGEMTDRMDRVDREALAHNEAPMALSFYPSGKGDKLKPFATISGGVVQMPACKKAENIQNYIVRLFEPTGKERTTTVNFPALGIRKKVRLGGFEVKSFKLNVRRKTLTEVDLMEK